MVAHALITQAWLRRNVGDVEGAIAHYARVATRFQTDTNPGVRTEVAQALQAKGAELAKLGRDHEALAAFDDQLEFLANDRTVDARRQTAMALHGKVRMLFHEGSLDEAMIVADGLMDRFESEHDERAFELLRDALIEAGHELLTAERWEKAIEVIDALIAGLQNSTEPTQRGMAALLLNDKALALTGLGQSHEAHITGNTMLAQLDDDALAALDQNIASTADTTDQRTTSRHVTALLQRAIVLGQLNRIDQAAQAFDDLIERFNPSDDPAVKKLVAAARECRADLPTP
jgi:tetratricopeptide (TPR) repeat protein